MTTTVPAESAAPIATKPGEWQAVYVFYMGNPRPVLTQCVRPLIEELRASGLLAGYFFINYWLEGQHVRLRLKPVSAAATTEVRARAEAAIREFLRARPSLFNARLEEVYGQDAYKVLLEQEFTPEEQARLILPDGRMNVRQNNTFSWERYEPEFSKYGGVDGVALAEWHFEKSSDFVIHALRTMNLHVRPVLLGLAAQLMVVMATRFLREREIMADFMDLNHDSWYGWYGGSMFVPDVPYGHKYADMAESLRARVGTIHTALIEQQEDQLPDFIRGWAEHCAEFGERIGQLAAAGKLVFRSLDGSRDETITDPLWAKERMLFPLLHMTNNRLSVLIGDEIYLSFLLARALRDLAGQEAP